PGGGAAARPAPRSDPPPERHVAAAREGFHRRVRIEHHHVFRHLRAHLEAEAGAASGNCRGAAPRRSATLNDTPTLLDTQLARHGSRDDQTEPALPPEQEPRFEPP